MAKEKKKSLRFKVILIILIVLLLAGGGYAFYYFTTPQITLKGDATMEVTMKDGYDEPGAEATFSFHDISSHIKIDSQDLNVHKVGTYTVTYTVDYMNKTASKTRTVNVIDREPPEITITDGDSVSVRPMSKTGSTTKGRPMPGSPRHGTCPVDGRDRCLRRMAVH